MKKIFGIAVGIILFGVFLFQAQNVLVLAGKTSSDKPLTSPVPPVSSPCKPGSGYGDKNHCHVSPTPTPTPTPTPKQEDKHHKDNHNDKHDGHHDDHNDKHNDHGHH